MTNEPTNNSTGAPAKQLPHEIQCLPGVLGLIAAYMYRSAIHPATQISIAGAIALLSAICSRAYNTFTGAGLNQYILLAAGTGTGKEVVGKAVTRLFAEMVKLADDAAKSKYASFKGPGEIVSSAGLIKWLVNHPAILCMIGEIGIKIALWANPKAGPNEQSITRLFLMLYSKSDEGDVFDPTAYSDKDKNTPPILSPALTIFGETTVEQLNRILTPEIISSGLLPRFLIFEHTGIRENENENRLTDPPVELVNELANIVAQAVSLSGRSDVCRVPADEAARAEFKAFSQHATDRINGSSSEATKQLWNRAHLKAIKLASVRAIGENFFNPVVDQAGATWATHMVAAQIVSLQAKFERGDTGEVIGNEAKQIAEVIRVITEYLTSPHERYAKLQPRSEMHRDGVITESYISRRLITLSAFSQKSTMAIKQAIKSLLEADDLREMSKNQMQQKYGAMPRAFVVSNPQRFSGD